MKVPDNSGQHEFELYPAERIAHTLFAHNPSVVIIDEAHEYRNRGSKSRAAIALARQADSTILLTATPVITSILVSHRYL